MSNRPLSFWGWGYEDRFPDADTRRQLGQLLSALLGAPEMEPREPPTLESITLPEPRFESIPLTCPTSTSRRDRASHTYGRGFADLLRGFEGDFGRAPDLVAWPRHEADVVEVLAWASANAVAVIPFGGGTSVVAGTEPDVPPSFAGVISLDMRRMNRVLDVDLVDRTARIEAGALGPEIEAQLAPHGLTLRHFPQSFEFSTLGGWIATRSGGHFATLYTHIDELVVNARMVTPTGVIEPLRLPASGAGPDPNRLICGSEGTLGVITEARMRLRPRPRNRVKASVRFTDFDAAVAVTRAIAQTELYPSNCRLLDAREALLHSVSDGQTNVLLVGFESASLSLDDAMAQALAICREGGGEPSQVKATTAGDARVDDAQAGAWRDAFLEAPYRFNALVSLGVVVDTFETACTWSAFPALHEAVIQRLKATMQEVCGHRGWVSCRFTHVYPDGPAPYYTFIAPGRSGEALAQWRAIKQAACEVLVEHGAAITHHHAVGRLHRPWHLEQSPPAYQRALSAVKASLDPAGILNPGALL